MENLEITSELNLQVQRSLGRLEGKLDYLLSRITEHFDTDAKSFSEINKQLETIKQKTWMQAGAWATIGTAVGLLTMYLTFFKHI